MTETDSRSRLAALRKLLTQGAATTQEELRDHLKKEGFETTQSTISRDLRKVGAIRTIDARGRTVYRVQEESGNLAASTTSLKDLILGIRTNGSVIVINTTPGSASLIARHLDRTRPHGILGTIAGDDTIFVAPTSLSATSIRNTIRAIDASFDVES